MGNQFLCYPPGQSQVSFSDEKGVILQKEMKRSVFRRGESITMM